MTGACVWHLEAADHPGGCGGRVLDVPIGAELVSLQVVAPGRGIGVYFDFYNHRRLHQSLDYRTPAEVYFQTAAARQKQTAVIESTIAAKGKGATLDGALFLS